MATITTKNIVLHQRVALSFTANAAERNAQEDRNDLIPDIINKSFRSGERGWMEEPVIQQWTSAPLTILEQANRLYHQWSSKPPGPFCPFSDPLWMKATEALREVGLPWHNNNLNSPEEVDPSCMSPGYH